MVFLKEVRVYILIFGQSKKHGKTHKECQEQGALTCPRSEWLSKEGNGDERGNREGERKGERKRIILVSEEAIENEI